MRIKGEVKREGQKRLKKRKNRKNQWAFQALPDMRTEPLTVALLAGVAHEARVCTGEAGLSGLWLAAGRGAPWAARGLTSREE